MTRTAPYGTWPSALTPAALVAGTTRLSFPRIVGGVVHWLEQGPATAGRTQLWRTGAEAPAPVTPPEADVRSTVHEYGGLPYAAAPDGTVVVVDATDGRLHRIDVDGSRRPVTPTRDELGGDVRYGAPELTGRPGLGGLVAVREDHRGPGEAVSTLVALDPDGPNTDGGRVLWSGSDFVGAPAAGAAHLAWVTWDHPAMPWTEAVLRVAPWVDGDELLGEVEARAGGPGVAVSQPRWSGHGVHLDVVSDASGWSRVTATGGGDVPDRPLSPDGVDVARADWQLGSRAHASVGDEDLAYRWWDSARGRLAVRTGTGTRQVDQPGSVEELDGEGGTLVVRLRYDDRPSAICTVDVASGRTTVVRAPGATPDPADVSRAEHVTWRNGRDLDVHGLWFPPRSAGVTGPADAAPPLVLMAHGGPTDHTGTGYDRDVQFWTTRGFGVLHVNYGGSTGYGRDYRRRLDGEWGVVDVDDCVTGALALADRGLVDRDRMVVRGGSAGGFLVYRLLVDTDAFAAGASYFGVADLTALAEETHKFESRYLDGLVGPYPEAAATYRERSPLHQVDRLTAPLVLFQGADDKVVPPGQSEALAEALRVRDVPVELHLFEGEGHGFRDPGVRETAAAAELAFYQRVLGLVSP